jgi:hypothetical protein
LSYEVPFPAETLYSFDVDVKKKGRKKERKRKEGRKEQRKKEKGRKEVKKKER